MAEVKKYAVWEDSEYGYNFGEAEKATGRIVEYCDTYEEARITWKWYYYKP